MVPIDPESYLKTARKQLDYYYAALKNPSSCSVANPVFYLDKAEQNLDYAEFYGIDVSAERERLSKFRRLRS